MHVAQITQLIDSFHIGGLIFFQGGPVRQANLTNFYQARSKYPLLIGIDGEWGLNMRLDSTIRFPRQMTLSAGAGEGEIYRMGAEIARQCRRIGIHINFAPDVDINNNPLNPIINSRSFGEDKEVVTRFGRSYMLGMQENGVMACAKHFPGHGDTDTDSHYDLPVIKAHPARIDSLELYPFKKLIREGLAAVMVAHLFVPGIDSTPNRASTLSSAIVCDLLKDSLRFDGLVFTDALNMKGVANFYAPGELEVNALLAGNDVLLYPRDVARAVEQIHFAIQNCIIDQSLIDEKVIKILRAKYWAGLSVDKQIETNGLYRDLNSYGASWLNYSLYEDAPTLLKNEKDIIPLNSYYRDCMASVVLNDTCNNPFQLQLAAYGHVDAFYMPKEASAFLMDSLAKVLNDYDRVIVSIHNTSINAQKNFGLSPSVIEMTEKLGRLKGSVLCVFGNAYVLGKLRGAEHYEAIVEAYEDTYLPQVQTAQKIFGATAFSGKLPVSAYPEFVLGQGLKSVPVNCLKYTLPEECSVESNRLSEIDSLMQKAIGDSVFPGAQLLIAKDQKVIFSKSFGWHTYERLRPVKNTDVYDIASVTKIAATALAAMYLYDKRKLDPDAKASRYLPALKHSNKKDITIRQLMAHEAGLKAWIPFWKETVDSNGWVQGMYSKVQEKGYALKVADSMYIKDDYREIIWKEILESPLETTGKYVYSDLGLIILQKIIEKISGKPLDHLVEDVFYKPLGLCKFGYHPLQWTSRENIVPSERDSAFRRQVVQGYVHDPAAAMMGGVAGHAGVFSNAQALAVIMQMLLNNGEYAGRHYLRAETVKKFTAKAYPETVNRRGLIFDKPDPAAGENGPAATNASPLSFGHSGFTGTYAWADPQSGLVYIFLSNRVYPTALNNKLAKTNLRTRIMKMAIEAFPAN